MTDNKHEAPGLPGAQVVAQFSDEIRGAIAAGIRDGTKSARTSAVRWYLASLFVSAGLAAVVSWFYPHPSSPSWTIHHGDGFIETCSVAPGSPRNQPVFLCHVSN